MESVKYEIEGACKILSVERDNLNSYEAMLLLVSKIE
jgi:hypothetical protein